MPKSSKKKVPKKLQGVLWSVDVKDLDLGKNKSYIIHQIFSYGRMEEILWLFKVYPLEIIREVFSTYPFKDYDPVRFHFVKNYLLDLNNSHLNEQRYVKNIPRDIR